jgi:alkanesulfonate monooxygenase SsuD/methylene tetrahydromethanopterin reductase-like flavin-dependent oxidoreductase (luciferase family)
MNVGIYLDLRKPSVAATTTSRLYGFTLELCEEAERLGCHSVWLTEHHGFDDGYLPQPLTMAAAIAARTRRMRIGTAVVIAPLHHPADVAEQGAIVDNLSDGRLDIGIGAGYRLPEYELFGVDPRQRYEATDRCATELRRLWTGVVTPGPTQSRVPIWMGYQGPMGARRAGNLGEGLLSCDARLWPHYRQALVEAGHDAATARMAGSINGWVSDDPEGDWPVVTRHVAAQFDSYRRYMVEGTGRPLPRPVDPEKLRSRQESRGPLDSIVYGTPEEVAQRIRLSTAGSPVETVFFWASIAGMPEDLAIRHVHTLCQRLAPLLADSGQGEPSFESAKGRIIDDEPG